MHDQFLGEVAAHKLILGLASPVFRAGLFASDNIDKKAKVLKTEAPTVKSFQTMMDFMYKKPIDFNGMTIYEIFDLVGLAERYVLNEQLENVKVTKETVLEDAKTAAEFELFEEYSKTLLRNCVKMLDNELKTKESVRNFCSEVTNTEDEVIGFQTGLHDERPGVLQLSTVSLQVGLQTFTSIEQVRVGNCFWPPTRESMSLMGFLIMCLGDIGLSGEKLKSNQLVETSVKVTNKARGKFYEYDDGPYPTQYEGDPTFRFSCGEDIARRFYLTLFQ